MFWSLTQGRPISSANPGLSDRIPLGFPAVSAIRGAHFLATLDSSPSTVHRPLSVLPCSRLGERIDSPGGIQRRLAVPETFNFDVLLSHAQDEVKTRVEASFNRHQ